MPLTEVYNDEYRSVQFFSDPGNMVVEPLIKEKWENRISIPLQ